MNLAFLFAPTFTFFLLKMFLNLNPFTYVLKPHYESASNAHFITLVVNQKPNENWPIWYITFFKNYHLKKTMLPLLFLITKKMYNLSHNKKNVQFVIGLWSPITNPTIFNIIRWVNGTNESSPKRLMFQVFIFFIISCKILCKNPFLFFF